MPHPLRCQMLFITLLATGTARASMPVGAWLPEGQPICVAQGDQVGPRAIPDGAGGAMMAWQDHRASTWDVYLTRITPAGAPAAGWPSNGLRLAPDAGDQFLAGLCGDGSGGAFVLWTDARSQPPEIHLERVDGSGTPVAGWPAEGIIVSAGTGAVAPQMTAGDSGAVLVVWEDTRLLDVIQKFTGAGTIAAGWPGAGIDALALTSPDRLQAPQVVGDGAGGGYVVALYSYRFCAEHCFSGSGLVARHVAATGALLHQFGESGAVSFGIAPDQAEGLLVWWTTDTQNSFLADVDGPANFTANIAGLPLLSDAAPTGGSDELLAFSASGNLYDVYLLDFGAGGTIAPGWPAGGVLVSTAPGNQTGASVLADGSGGAWLAWSDTRSGLLDLYGTHVGPAGLVTAGWTPNGDPICDLGGDQELGSLIPSPPDGAIVVWQDGRAGNWDIYGQRLTVGTPVGVMVSAAHVSTSPDGVRLSWNTEVSGSVVVERRTSQTPWTPVSRIVVDGLGNVVFDDRSVSPGDRLCYRLALPDGSRSPETWVQVPIARFALHGLAPNPGDGTRLRVAFSLDVPGVARIELLDLAGRMMGSIEQAFGAGEHVVAPFSSAVGPGVYWLRLTEGQQRTSLKAAVVR